MVRLTVNTSNSIKKQLECVAQKQHNSINGICCLALDLFLNNEHPTAQVANQDAPEYDIQRVFDAINAINPSERKRSKHKDRAISQVIQEHGVVPVLEKIETCTVRNLIPDTLYKLFINKSQKSKYKDNSAPKKSKADLEYEIERAKYRKKEY